MTYTPPAAVHKEVARLLRKGAIQEEVVDYVAKVTATDVVNMAAAALVTVERHDPACTQLWQDEEPCDCSWAQIATVIEQLKAKVAPT